MGKKKFVKIISLTVAICMAISLLAGCNGKSGPSSNADGTANAGQSDTSADSKNSTEPAKTGPSWTWDTSPVTLDWYIDFDWYGGKWYPDSLVHKEITKRTGVTLNFITPPAGSSYSGGASDKLITMIAADDLPDIMTMGAYAPQLALLEEAGKVTSLLDLAEKEAPDFKDVLPQSMSSWWSYKDGKLYIIPGGFKAKETPGSEKTMQTQASMVARKDIMDQLGIKPEDFNTQDGMVAALKKVKDANIMYNNKRVSPFYAGSEGGIGDTFGWIISEMWAIPKEGKDGKLIDTRLDPKTLEMFKFGNRLFREGLLEKENFTAKRQQIEEKLSSGQIFCFSAVTGDYADAWKNLVNSDPKCVWVSVGPVRASDNANPAYGVSGNGWTALMLNNASEKKARALKFLTFWLSKEGQDLVNLGMEGQTYTRSGGVDGHFKWTEEYEKEKIADEKAAEQKYGLGQLWILNNDGYMGQLYPKTSSVTDQMIDSIYAAGTPYFYDVSVFMVGLDTGTDEVNLEAQINEYWSQQISKMFFANSPEEVEKIYAETVKHMQDLGIQRVTDAKDVKFQEYKKKMNLDFAFPTNK